MDVFEDTPVFYINKNNSHLPFDPFAAAFYLISRYEEYFDGPRDQFGRFPAEESLAYKNNFLHQPVIDIWAKYLLAVLQNQYPDLESKVRSYRFIPTYDIDNAYAYKHKGFLRIMGGFANALRKMNWKECRERLKVLANRTKDPYDTYELQFELHDKYGLQPVYFFPVGEYGEYDKNISPESPAYRNLIQSLSDYYRTGIHPSFRSNNDIKILDKEVSILSQILKKDIVYSRQHYVKLHLPQTYENLMELDIEKDYSMGYPSQVGFRASTASSFYFYDLNLEIKTKLKVYPFAVMDVSLRHYLRLHPDDAIRQIEGLIREVKAVGGLFISLWHNHSLGETHGWEGWRKVYEQMIAMATHNKEQGTATLPQNA